MNLIDPDVEDYLRTYLNLEDPVLKEMEELAGKRRFPIIGPLVGQLLTFLITAVKARRVLELGSGYGYSMLWIARALGEKGEITGVETSKENIDLAHSYLGRAELKARWEILHGDALEVAKTLSGPFDVVFNDVDKHQYPQVVDLALAMLREGGLLITDNALWHGRVLKPEDDPDTTGVIRYSQRIFSETGLRSAIIPVRDGVAVSVKT
ncbi:O-methyltransferase [Acidobacteriota bacterium]